MNFLIDDARPPLIGEFLTLSTGRSYVVAVEFPINEVGEGKVEPYRCPTCHQWWAFLGD